MRGFAREIADDGVQKSPGTGFKCLQEGFTSFPMKLADWMNIHNLTPRSLKYVLGVNSRSTVTRWLSGERQPTPPMMKQIEALTNGAVTLKDFYDPRPPRCLRRITDRKGRVRIVYPWTEIENHKPRQAENQNDRSRSDRCGPSKAPISPPHDPWPSPPLRKALDSLGARAAISNAHGFTLDGRPVDARRLVTEANRVRKRFNLPPIFYPGVHPFPLSLNDDSPQ